MNRRAFTLIELMVVVGIIAVLIAILLPVMASVKRKAYHADTQQWIQQLAGAIERYQSDHRAYPGPLLDAQVYTSPNAYVATPFTSFTANASSGTFITAFNPMQVTGSENLVLGLLGGLSVTAPPTNNLVYDPAQVGLGPLSLNPQNPKRGTPYIDAINLSWRVVNGSKTGEFADGTGGANDTIIPEFVDKYPEAMPVLYLRARRGIGAINTGTSTTNNSVITYSAPAQRVGTYDLSQIIGYTGTLIGEGKTIKSSEYAGGTQFPQHGLRTVTLTASTQNPPPPATPAKTYIYPFDAYAYFESPSMPNTARNKDSYILIAAGADRVYGTRDDVVNFGSVGE